MEGQPHEGVCHMSTVVARERPEARAKFSWMRPDLGPGGVERMMSGFGPVATKIEVAPSAVGPKLGSFRPHAFLWRCCAPESPQPMALVHPMACKER